MNKSRTSSPSEQSDSSSAPSRGGGAPLYGSPLSFASSDGRPRLTKPDSTVAGSPHSAPANSPSSEVSSVVSTTPRGAPVALSAPADTSGVRSGSLGPSAPRSRPGSPGFSTCGTSPEPSSVSVLSDEDDDWSDVVVEDAEGTMGPHPMMPWMGERGSGSWGQAPYGAPSHGYPSFDQGTFGPGAYGPASYGHGSFSQGSYSHGPRGMPPSRERTADVNFNDIRGHCQMAQGRIMRLQQAVNQQVGLPLPVRDRFFEELREIAQDFISAQQSSSKLEQMAIAEMARLKGSLGSALADRNLKESELASAWQEIELLRARVMDAEQKNAAARASGINANNSQVELYAAADEMVDVQDPDDLIAAAKCESWIMETCKSASTTDISHLTTPSVTEAPNTAPAALTTGSNMDIMDKTPTPAPKSSASNALTVGLGNSAPAKVKQREKEYSSELSRRVAEISVDSPKVDVPFKPPFTPMHTRIYRLQDKKKSGKDAKSGDVDTSQKTDGGEDDNNKERPTIADGSNTSDSYGFPPNPFGPVGIPRDVPSRQTNDSSGSRSGSYSSLGPSASISQVGIHNQQQQGWRYDAGTNNNMGMGSQYGMPPNMNMGGPNMGMPPKMGPVVARGTNVGPGSGYKGTGYSGSGYGGGTGYSGSTYGGGSSMSGGPPNMNMMSMGFPPAIGGGTNSKSSGSHLVSARTNIGGIGGGGIPPIAQHFTRPQSSLTDYTDLLPAGPEVPGEADQRWSQIIFRFFTLLKGWANIHCAEASAATTRELQYECPRLWKYICTITYPDNREHAASHATYMLNDPRIRPYFVTRLLLQFVVQQIWSPRYWETLDPRLTDKLVGIRKRLERSYGYDALVSPQERIDLVNQRASAILSYMQTPDWPRLESKRVGDTVLRCKDIAGPLLSTAPGADRARALRELAVVCEKAVEASAQLNTSKLHFSFIFNECGVGFAEKSHRALNTRLDPLEIQARRWRIMVVVTPGITYHAESEVAVEPRLVSKANVLVMP